MWQAPPWSEGGVGILLHARSSDDLSMCQLLHPWEENVTELGGWHQESIEEGSEEGHQYEAACALKEFTVQ